MSFSTMSSVDCGVCKILSKLHFDEKIKANEIMKKRRCAVQDWFESDLPMCKRHSDFRFAFQSVDFNLCDLFTKDVMNSAFIGRNDGNRLIERRQLRNLVINCVKQHEIRENFEEILKLQHTNIEFIHEFDIIGDKCYFVTNLFVAKLTDVWENRFPVFNVEKIFIDLFNGLMYLRSNNICHGFIHDRNIGYDGQNFLFSGLASVKKDGVCSSFSGCRLDKDKSLNCIRSPRYFKFFLIDNLSLPDLTNFLKPADDLWQTIFMYFLTKFRLHPLKWKSNNNVDQTGVFCWNDKADQSDFLNNSEDRILFHRVKNMLFAGIHSSVKKYFTVKKDNFWCDMRNEKNPESLEFNFEEYENNVEEFRKILFF